MFLLLFCTYLDEFKGNGRSKYEQRIGVGPVIRELFVVLVVCFDYIS